MRNFSGCGRLLLLLLLLLLFIIIVIIIIIIIIIKFKWNDTLYQLYNNMIHEKNTGK